MQVATPPHSLFSVRISGTQWSNFQRIPVLRNKLSLTLGWAEFPSSCSYCYNIIPGKSDPKISLWLYYVFLKCLHMNERKPLVSATFVIHRRMRLRKDGWPSKVRLRSKDLRFLHLLKTAKRRRLRTRRQQLHLYNVRKVPVPRVGTGTVHGTRFRHHGMRTSGKKTKYKISRYLH